MVVVKNKFIQEFGLEIPIVQGPMGGVSGPGLVAAVANSGGLGILPIWSDSVGEAKSAIEKTKNLTSRSFGVNLRADLVQVDHIKMALDLGVSIFHLFWGDPTSSMTAIDQGGARMMATVGDLDAAKAALDAGARALVVQGREAGGHVLGTIPTAELLVSVMDISGGIPLVVAGGCANGADIKRYMSIGASGVLLGTRFVASLESEAHDDYKQALIEAGENATVRSLCFDLHWPDAPHRTLINNTFRLWDQQGRSAMGERPDETDVILKAENGFEIQRYSAIPPKQGMTGDIREGAMYAGTGVAQINSCLSVSEILNEIRTELD